MDLSDYDSNSSETIVLWANDLPIAERNVPSYKIRKQLNEKLHKVPQELSENYLYLVTKLAEDLVNRVITDSEWIVHCSKAHNK